MDGTFSRHRRRRSSLILRAPQCGLLRLRMTQFSGRAKPAPHNIKCRTVEEAGARLSAAWHNIGAGPSAAAVSTLLTVPANDIVLGGEGLQCERHGNDELSMADSFPLPLWRRNAGQKCSSQTNFGCGLLLRWLKAEGWLDRCIGGRRGKSSSKRDSARI